MQNQALSASPSGLTRIDFTLMRAWVQGLPLDWIASRYLTEMNDDGEWQIPDLRVVQSRLIAIRDALVQRAHQHGETALAQALLKDVRYSDKGISQVLNAVNQLERLGTPKPALDHTVAFWFAPALARRLQAAQLSTLRQVIARCNERGAGWWRALPRIGAKAAQNMVAFCRQHEAVLGIAIGAHVTRDLTLPHMPVVRMPETIDGRTQAVPPLEVMRLPAYCDGSFGENRAQRERCVLDARNDYEAVLTWLSLWPNRSPTWRAYRKEAERFLAWAVIERATSLSSLKTEDCIAYREFLVNPLPRERWCGPMLSRSLPGWRPFQGPLSPQSQAYAIQVVKNLCEFLTRKHYLHANPWDGVPLKRRYPRLQIEKALPIEVWHRLWAWLEQQSQLPDAAQWRLAKAAIGLMRDSGLRLIETCRADRANMVPLADPNHEVSAVWGECAILGKREQWREVPISQRTVHALRDHWRDRQLDFDLAVEGPLIGPLRIPKTPRAQAKQQRNERHFSPSGVHKVVATALICFADSLGPEEGALAARLRETRAHALRHTFGSHAAADGVPVDVLQQIFGHRSLATTTIYTQPEKKRRLREIGKLYQK